MWLIIVYTTVRACTVYAIKVYKTKWFILYTHVLLEIVAKTSDIAVNVKIKIMLEEI